MDVDQSHILTIQINCTNTIKHARNSFKSPEISQICNIGAFCRKTANPYSL
uniref:Uncharacterized protein n=1 Tax=Rhizophora mucronata TaxID=61149 RepID=A0A2P2QE86_RHIMU